MTWLRAAFFILIVALGYSVYYNISNLSYFLLVILIFGSVINFRGFEVSFDHVKVERYFFYSFIKQTLKFDKKAGIRISGSGLQFDDNHKLVLIDPEPEAGCLLSILLLFIPSQKITHRYFTLEGESPVGKDCKAVLQLSKEEFYYISENSL